MWNRKHFLWYYVFSSQMRHLCGSLCILVYKNADVDNFYKNRWGVWLKFLYRFKGYYNVFCGTENIFCDITYFPHKCATFVPFVFPLQKCWRILELYINLKLNVFCGTKTFSVILRIFLTNAPPLWFPLYFGLQKWLKFL